MPFDRHDGQGEFAIVEAAARDAFGCIGIAPRQDAVQTASRSLPHWHASGVGSNELMVLNSGQKDYSISKIASIPSLDSHFSRLHVDKALARALEDSFDI